MTKKCKYHKTCKYYRNNIVCNSDYEAGDYCPTYKKNEELDIINLATMSMFAIV